MVTPQCILISPFRSEEKHPANPIAIGQRFLNFGALSLASFLTRNAYDTVVLDEYTIDFEQGLETELRTQFGDERPLLVGISSISSYSADRVCAILQLLTNLWPNVPRLIGGQHFVGYWGNHFADMMPGADMLVSGEGESAILEILNALRSGKTLHTIEQSELPANVFWKVDHNVRQGTRIPSTKLPIDLLMDIDYARYPGSDRLFPSIEFSRGCPYACVFCANGLENRLGYRRASPARVGAAVARLVEVRVERPVRFYMQASNFAVTKGEAALLAKSLAPIADKVHWRTEVRVDSVEDGSLTFLHAAGLRVLDIGLESASPQILTVMRKTLDPILYLTRAEKLLRDATALGIFTKVNFLIHPGDTCDTVAESWDWLQLHSDVISGISSGVALEYPGTPLSDNLGNYESEFGTKRLPHPLSRWGVYNLQPSSSLSHSDAERLATKIAQSMQTRLEFAKSKSFGYVGVGKGYGEILASLPEADHTTPYETGIEDELLVLLATSRSYSLAIEETMATDFIRQRCSVVVGKPTHEIVHPRQPPCMTLVKVLFRITSTPTKFGTTF